MLNVFELYKKEKPPVGADGPIKTHVEVIIA